jgi:hypothetical protein
MGKRKTLTSTEKMLQAVADAEEDKCPTFPSSFLVGLRGALDAGLSEPEITALLVLFTGVYEASVRMSGETLVNKAQMVAEVMAGDITDQNLHRLRIKRNKENRKEKSRRKKNWYKKKIGGGR